MMVTKNENDLRQGMYTSVYHWLCQPWTLSIFATCLSFALYYILVILYDQDCIQ